jgi:DNA adenine methylase
MSTKSPLSWHGGKHYMANRLIEMMPQHRHYVETHFGAGSLLFAKSFDGISEVANDIDGHLMNFWRVLQSPSAFEALRRRLEATSVSEDEFVDAKVWSGDDVEDAARLFILCKQSLGSRMETFAPVARGRTRRGMNERASSWLSAIDRLDEAHARLQRVVLVNRCATEVIVEEDTPHTLLYIDPPYLPDTRAAKQVYSKEMSPIQHEGLLKVLEGRKGKFMLSGYRSDMYDKWATHNGFVRVDMQVRNPAACGAQMGAKKVESVWMNFTPDVIVSVVS